MSNRVDFIDFLKGIGIIFVVYAHMMLPYNNIIFIFHMSLFFLLSGFFYKQDSCLKKLVIKKINTLIIPSLFFYLLGYFRYVFLNYWDFRSFSTIDFSSIFAIFTGNEKGMWEVNFPIWFLISLFHIHIIYYTISKFVTNVILKDIVVFILLLISIWLGINKIDLPYFFDSALFGLLFFHIGNRISKYNLFRSKTKFDWYLIFIFAFIFILLISKEISPCDISFNQIEGSIFMFFAECFSIIFFLFFLAKRISYIKFVNFLGFNSLIILGIHMEVLFFMSRVFNKLNIDQSNFLIGGVVMLSIILLIFIPIIFLLNKYLPEMIGKKPLLKM